MAKLNYYVKGFMALEIQQKISATSPLQQANPSQPVGESQQEVSQSQFEISSSFWWDSGFPRGGSFLIYAHRYFSDQWKLGLASVGMLGEGTSLLTGGASLGLEVADHDLYLRGLFGSSSVEQLQMTTLLLVGDYYAPFGEEKPFLNFEAQVTYQSQWDTLAGGYVFIPFHQSPISIFAGGYKNITLSGGGFIAGLSLYFP